MKQIVSDQQIIDCLKTDYGIDVISLSLLPWGADINATVYKAKARDAVYFIKVKQGHHHELSAALAKHLYAAGIAQIIPPVSTIQGQTTQITGDFTLIAYPFVEGENGFKHTLSENQWIQFGKAMRQVHEIDISLSKYENVLYVKNHKYVSQHEKISI